MMNRYIWIVYFLFFSAISLSAQNATLTIGTGKKCAGQEVLLNVNGVHLIDVGAITLYIEFDPNALTFVSLDNLDPQFDGLLYNYLPEISQVVMSWSNVTPAVISDAKLFDLKFQVKGGSTQVAFMTGCEIVNSSFNPIDVTYTNGAVEQGNPTIVNQPQHVTVTAGKNTTFGVASPDATEYRWEKSMDKGTNWNDITDGVTFSGSQTNELSITNVPVAFDQYQFRCLTGYEGCYTLSDAATLSVDSTTSMSDKGSRDSFFLRTSPNPFTNLIRIECNFPEEGTVYIKILSSAGQEIIKEKKESGIMGTRNFSLNLEQLTKGMYICLVELHTSTGIIANAKKIIKEKP